MTVARLGRRAALVGDGVSLGAALVGDVVLPPFAWGSGIAEAFRSSPCRLVTVDADGVLWLLAQGTRAECVRWCLERGVYPCGCLGVLVTALVEGRFVGLMPEVARHVAFALEGRR